MTIFNGIYDNCIYGTGMPIICTACGGIKLLKDLKELAEYDQSTSTNYPIFLNDNEDHPVQNRESLENSSEENVEPPQNSDIHQLIEECSVEVPEEQKQKIEDTMFDLVTICHHKQFLFIHDDIDNLIESALDSKLLSINSIKSQRLDKKEQEVKIVEEQPAERRNLTPILSTKELENSLSMGYEHLSITPETKSDEVTESNAKNLLPIPSECEVALEDKRECTVPISENFPDCDNHSDTFSDSKINDDISVYDDDFEDIEYVEASLLDSEIFSIEEENGIEEENVVQREEEEVDLEDISQVQDVVIREKLFSITRLISNIKSLNDNSTPDRVFNSFESDNSLLDNFLPEFETFCDKSEETRSGNTTHANYSLPEYDLFCFEIEHDQERLINLVKNDNSDSSNDPLLEEVDLFLSDNSIPPGIENVVDDPEGDICFLEELLIDDSILSHESFDNFEENPSIPRPPPEPPDDNFDLESEVISAVMEDNDEPDEYFNPGREIFVSTNIKDVDYFPFMFVIRIFLPYLILSEISPLLLFAESEDTIFDPAQSRFSFPFALPKDELIQGSSRAHDSDYPPMVEDFLCRILSWFPRPSTDIPEADMPPRKKACLTAPALGFEIRESFAAGAIVDKMMRIALNTLEGVNERVTELDTTVRQRTDEFEVRFEDTQFNRALLRARVNTLFRDRPDHRHTSMLMDREAMYSREAWTFSMDRSSAIAAHVRTLETQVVALITQTTSLQTQLTTALGRIELSLYGMLSNMENGTQEKNHERNNTATTTTPTTTITNAQLQALINRGVAAELAERDADRSRNGDNNNDSGTGGRRKMTTPRECSYTDFLKCQPMSFQGTKGVVKFASCTLQGSALTWWNSHIRVVGPDVAYEMPWAALKRMITDKYCPSGEIQKLESRYWNLKVKGVDLLNYNHLFQELALMCDRMFPEESAKVEKYIGGLPNIIHGSVKASKPQSMQEAIKFATEMMDKKMLTLVERQAEYKRKFDDTSRNTQHQQQPPKRNNVARAYTATQGDRKPYGGTKPLCPKCNYHHDRPCAPKCTNCKKIDHLARDCKGRRHYKSDFPKLKNGNQGNRARNGNAVARAYAVGTAGTNPNSNVVTGTFLLNNRNALVLFDTGAERSFVSMACCYQELDLLP
uniref:CCHC-type domain-containing protein n=1 Tax=Tanacetum cinerariifolium TaxID=118510 RepID=A0A6L2LUT9_TANCI|nr:hypothetical protein [Tanacetum cinerariifolium]